MLAAILEWIVQFFTEINFADVAIALFTGALWLSTRRLWKETQRLAEGAEDQSKKMVLAINATNSVAGRTKEVADAMDEAASAMRQVAGVSEAAMIATSQSSERQLRAYLSTKKTRISAVEAGAKPVVTITIQNTGLTPAYDLTMNLAIGMHPHPVSEQYFANAPVASRLSKTTVGPRQSVKHSVPMSVSLGIDHILGLQEDKAAIYVIGIINYVDAFKRPRFKKIRLMYTHRSFANGSKGLEVCENGNEED